MATRRQRDDRHWAKSVQAEHPVHKKQTLTDIQRANNGLGLLVNFGAPPIKDGITRLANRLPEAA